MFKENLVNRLRALPGLLSGRFLYASDMVASPAPGIVGGNVKSGIWRVVSAEFQDCGVAYGIQMDLPGGGQLALYSSRNGLRIRAHAADWDVIEGHNYPFLVYCNENAYLGYVWAVDSTTLEAVNVSAELIDAITGQGQALIEFAGMHWTLALSGASEAVSMMDELNHAAAN